jgi:hypothetical protein
MKHVNRRRFLALTGGISFTALSGCISNPGVNGGSLQVLSSETPPQATVTDASDDRIKDVQLIRTGIRQARKNGQADIEVSKRAYDTVAHALSALPWYSRTEHDSNYISGLYIRYEAAVYVVVLTPYCSGSLHWDAHSDRGEYGWGGCIEQG